MTPEGKFYRRDCLLGALGAFLMLVGDLCLSVIPAGAHDSGLFVREAYLNGSYPAWRLPLLLGTGLVGMALGFFTVRACTLQVRPEHRKTRLLIRIGGAIYLAVIALVLAVAYFVLGSIVGAGYAKYNLGLVDRAEPGFEVLFAYLPKWKTTALTRLWKSMYILVGTLLLVVPGIIMGYTYGMTDYILAEYPEMEPGEVLRTSKAMMTGNRWRLFCL